MSTTNGADLQQQKQIPKRRRLHIADEQAQGRMECIIREQLDLEIYEKQKEINTISERLRYSEALLEVVQSAIESHELASVSAEDIADGLMDRIRQEMHQIPLADNSRTMGRPRGRPRRAAAATPVKYTVDSSVDPLYAERDDGEAVRIICPSCQLNEFISLQHFLGHCQLEHNIGFPSHEEAIRICGVPTDARNSLPVTTNPTKSAHRTQMGTNLASRLNPDQISSVANALEEVSKSRRALEQISSDENESENMASAATRRTKGRHSTTTTTTTNIRNNDEQITTPVAPESRFHIIRRAVFGNTSQYVEANARPTGHENSTHRWTVFLQSASEEHPITDYVRKVRVFLHPSYRPDDIVDLAPPAFELTRWGWGEFPVKLQVFFCDKRNKPFDIVHMLKLDDLWSGECVLGSKVPIDFELDRRGISISSRNDKQTEQHSPLADVPEPPTNSLIRFILRELCRLYPLVLSDALPANAKIDPDSPEEMLELIPPSVIKGWTWGVAMTIDVFRNDWPLGKRLAAEKSRNCKLLSLIHSALQTTTSSLPDRAANDSVGSSLRSIVARIFEADSTVVGALQSSIVSAEDSTCQTAMDLLQYWSDSYRVQRPLQSDFTRSDVQNGKSAIEWSLKRWLRLSGFVPLPMLNANEAKAYGICSAPEAGYNPDPTASKDNSSELAGDSAATRSKQNVFCWGCGVLFEHANSSQKQPQEQEGLFCSARCRAAIQDHPRACTTVTRAADILDKLPPGWDIPEGEGEGEDDALLMIDDSETEAAAATVATTAVEKSLMKPASDGHSIESIADSLRQFHLHTQDKESLVGEDVDRGVDWVWSAIEPLDLSCAPASRLSAEGAASVSTDSGVLEQRLVVGQLVLDATRMFLRDLISASDRKMRQHRMSLVSSTKRKQKQDPMLMLTPLHVLAAVKEDPQAFDVCSNAYMADN